MNQTIAKNENKISPEYRTKVYKKSNTLINSKFRSSLMENKVLALGMAKAEYKEGRMIACLSAGELKRIFCTGGKSKNSGSFYSQLKNVASEMTTRRILIEDIEKQAFSVINLVGSATYAKGEFTIKFEPDLTGYLKDLKTNYTNLNLAVLMSFDKVYAYRLYEILKARAYTYETGSNEAYSADFDLAELKITLGVVDTNSDAAVKALNKTNPDFDKIIMELSGDSSLNDWSKFRSRILDPAVKEINEKSDLAISYETVKEGYGGKVTAVVFNFKKKNVVIQSAFTPSESEIDDMVDELIAYFDEPLKTKDAKKLLEASSYDIKRVEKMYNLSQKQNSIDNLVAWLLTALKRDYEDAIVSRKKKPKKTF